MVIFYTLAYNAEKTLPRTIQSVRDQTETDWIWYLLDNGAQDGTGKIIRASAEEDPRIIPIRNEKNNVFSPDTSFMELPKQYADSDWFCMLDADDTYTSNFLSEMLAFLERYRLDLAACGFDFIDAETGACAGQRVLPRDLILTSSADFNTYFSVYHQFMRTNWAKLFSVSLTKQLSLERVPDLCYGVDTLYTQELLRHAVRFGILSQSLHHYYVSRKSRSYHWDPQRIEADRLLHELACKFLIDKCGWVSPKNRAFLQSVYANAVSDTVAVIQNAALSPAERLREYRKIAGSPITLAAYRECTDESAGRSKALLLQSALEAGAALGGQDSEDLRAVVQQLLPRCGRAVTAANLALFLKAPELLKALLRDDSDAILRDLLSRVEQGRNVKKYALAETIQALAADCPLLCQINDATFLKRYGGIYWKVWQEDYLAALDEMTGLLMENQIRGGRETFLKLYISLSALLEQANAFIFGKLRLAELYFGQNRLAECRDLVGELEEMGLGEENEVQTLRSKLKNSVSRA